MLLNLLRASLMSYGEIKKIRSGKLMFIETSKKTKRNKNEFISGNIF